MKRAFGDRVAPAFLIDHLYLTGGEVQIRTPDGGEVLLQCRGDDFDPSQIFWRGLKRYEPEALLFWALSRESDAVVDVGAHLGVFSLLAAAANPHGKVIAVEPMPDVRSRLLANVHLNAAERVEVVDAAASSSDGTAKLVFVPGVSAPSSSGLNAAFFGGVKTDSVSVPTLRLDTMLSSLGVPLDDVGLLKIDVESHEPDVILGMGPLLSRGPTLMVEVLPESDTADAIQALTSECGYRFFELREDGPQETDRLGTNPAIRNYLLTTLRGDQVRAHWADALRV